MILRIKNWFSKQTQTEEEISLEQATALLLFEAATADYELDDTEKSVLLVALQQGLTINEHEAVVLLDWAIAHSAGSSSLHPFTSVINESLSPEEKTALMTRLWQIAYADGRIDKYEEHYLRHIADLIYLPHSKFIAAKLKAMPKD